MATVENQAVETTNGQMSTTTDTSEFASEKTDSDSKTTKESTLPSKSSSSTTTTTTTVAATATATAPSIASQAVPKKLLPQLMAAQKQIIALQWELQNSKKLEREQTQQNKRYESRIRELEDETELLQEEKDTLEDRHESHMEELRFLQNEFFCVKANLEKTKKELRGFRSLLQASKMMGGGFFSKRPRINPEDDEEIDDRCERVIDRQEFAVLVLDTTINSLKEILEEYVPPKPGIVFEEVNHVEDEENVPAQEETKQTETIQEDKSAHLPAPTGNSGATTNSDGGDVQKRPSSMRRGPSQSSTRKRISILDLAEPPSLSDEKNGSEKKKKKDSSSNNNNNDARPSLERKNGGAGNRSSRLMKSSRKLLKKTFSSRKDIKEEKRKQKEDERNQLINQLFKANQIRFAEYVESMEEEESKDTKGKFKEFANSRKSWGLSDNRLTQRPRSVGSLGSCESE